MRSVLREILNKPSLRSDVLQEGRHRYERDTPLRGCLRRHGREVRIKWHDVKFQRTFFAARIKITDRGESRQRRSEIKPILFDGGPLSRDAPVVHNRILSIIAPFF